MKPDLYEFYNVDLRTFITKLLLMTFAEHLNTLSDILQRREIVEQRAILGEFGERGILYLSECMKNAPRSPWEPPDADEK